MLDGVLLAIRNGATAVHVLKAYTSADSYTTVLANSCASAALATTDFTLANAALLARTLTSLPKTATAAAASGLAPNLHLAVVDATTQRVLWVTDETGDAVIALNAALQIPALLYTAQQPT